MQIEFALFKINTSMDRISLISRMSDWVATNVFTFFRSLTYDIYYL